MTRPDSIRCIEFVELVTDWLEGALTQADRIQVDEHLAGCEPCSIYVDQMRDTISMLVVLADDEPADEMVASLLKAFRRLRQGDES